MGKWAEQMIAAGGTLLNKYAAEQMPGVPAMRYVGKSTGGYSVLVRGTDAYVGYVSKLGNVWYGWHLGHIVTDERGEDKAFPTRKAAAEALWPVSVVERAARAHWRNATSDDRSVAGSDSPEYRASLAAFLLAIRAAYPDVDVQEEYNGFIDHAETVIQGVNITRQQRLASARQAELDALEEAAWEAEANAMEDARDERVQAAFEAAHTVPDVAAAYVSTAEADHASVVASPEAHEVPEERDITIHISREGALFVLWLVAVYPEATTTVGFTRNATPFTLTRGFYPTVAGARRTADLMAEEFRSNPDKIWAAYTVTLTGLASLSSRLSTPDVPMPTYRAAGFPSLDAAIGADYARR